LNQLILTRRKLLSMGFIFSLGPMGSAFHVSFAHTRYRVLNWISHPVSLLCEQGKLKLTSEVDWEAQVALFESAAVKMGRISYKAVFLDKRNYLVTVDWPTKEHYLHFKAITNLERVQEKMRAAGLEDIEYGYYI
jgi:hypothetical protein